MHTLFRCFQRGWRRKREGMRDHLQKATQRSCSSCIQRCTMLWEKVVSRPLKRINAPFMMNLIAFRALALTTHHLRWGSLPQRQLLVRQLDVPIATENKHLWKRWGAERSLCVSLLSVVKVCFVFLPVLLISTAVLLQQSFFQGGVMLKSLLA